MVILVLVVGEDAKDAGADHRQEGVLDAVGVAGVVPGVDEGQGEPDMLVERSDGQQPDVVAELAR